MSNLFFLLVPTKTAYCRETEAKIRKKLGARFDRSRSGVVAHANFIVITLSHALTAVKTMEDFATQTTDEIASFYTPAKWKRTWITSIDIISHSDDPQKAIVYFASTQLPNVGA